MSIRKITGLAFVGAAAAGALAIGGVAFAGGTGNVGDSGDSGATVVRIISTEQDPSGTSDGSAGAPAQGSARQDCPERDGTSGGTESSTADDAGPQINL